MLICWSHFGEVSFRLSSLCLALFSLTAPVLFSSLLASLLSNHVYVCVCMCVVLWCLVLCCLVRTRQIGKPSLRSAMSGETLVEASGDTDVQNKFFGKDADITCLSGQKCTIAVAVICVVCAVRNPQTCVSDLESRLTVWSTTVSDMCTWTDCDLEPFRAQDCSREKNMSPNRTRPGHHADQHQIHADQHQIRAKEAKDSSTHLVAYSLQSFPQVSWRWTAFNM